jgi:hypothetical protein
MRLGIGCDAPGPVQALLHVNGLRNRYLYAANPIVRRPSSGHLMRSNVMTAIKDMSEARCHLGPPDMATAASRLDGENPVAAQ